VLHLRVQVNSSQLTLSFVRVPVSDEDSENIKVVHRYAAAPHPLRWNRDVVLDVPAVIYDPKLPTKHLDSIRPARRQEGGCVCRKDTKLTVTGAEGPCFYIGGKRRRIHHQAHGRAAASMSAMGGRRRLYLVHVDRDVCSKLSSSIFENGRHLGEEIAHIRGQSGGVCQFDRERGLKLVNPAAEAVIQRI
jgi:hypothetical protein